MKYREEVQAVFHSHTNESCYPSESDFKYFKLYKYPWVIYSQIDGFAILGDSSFIKEFKNKAIQEGHNVNCKTTWTFS
jgi:proteasome lid subunit RPN8/RPN11